MNNRRLAVYISRFLLICLVLSFIAFTVFFNIFLKHTLEKNVVSQLEKDTQIISQVIDTYFTKYSEIVNQMTTNADLINYIEEIDSYAEHQSNPEADKICETLSKIENTDEDISLVWLGINSINGIIISEKMYESPEWFIIKERPWYKDMLLSNESITYSQPYVDSVTGNLIISIVSPVYDGIELIGTIGIDISLADIKEFIETYTISSEGYAFLLYTDGQYIVHPNASLMMNENILNGDDQLVSIGRSMISGEFGVAEYSDGFTDYYIAYGPITLNNWSVASVIPEHVLSHQLTLLNIMSTAIIFASIAILIVFIINYRVTRNFRNLKKLYTDIQEYTEQLAAKDEYIRNLAYSDPLTGISNRRRFLEHLEKALSNHHSGAVAMIDLDNFKGVNDTLGHIYGDKLLSIIASMLSQLECNEHVKVSRFGGDEFLILIDDIDDIAAINQQAKEILDLFSKKVVIDGNEIYIEISMGLSLFPQDSKHVNQLIMNADLAMYSVKNSGKNNFAFFDKSMTDEIIERTSIESALRQALHNNEFYLLYQPQVDVGTCEIIGFEALIRIKNSLLCPSKFIPVAEETGLIIPIGRWVVSEIITQLTLWREEGLNLKPVAINFSAKQLDDSGFVEYLDQLMDDHSISPELIEIEITETAIMENKNEALDLLNELKETGIQLSLDDFGTGYSSLSYLTFLPTDKLKLDKTLCDRYVEPTTVKVIENIIDISHTLKMKVVAEGIEKPGQYHLLKKIGCDCIQGYLFSRPISPKQASKKYNHSFIDIISETGI